MPRLIAVFAALLLVTLGSCEKSGKHFTLDPAMRPYFSFANGSEWKYVLKTDTNIAETVTVANHVEGKMIWDQMDQQFIQLDLQSDRDSTYKLRTIADEGNTSRSVVFVKDSFFKAAIEWYSTSGTFAAKKSTVNDSLVMHPTYTVQGKTYSNVIELTPGKPLVFKRIFIAPNVGIIQKELLSGKVYVLKSYTLQ